MDTALAAAKIVMTHVPSSTDTPRLPDRLGTATFAIDVSRTVIKVASATTIVAITSWPPCSGGCWTGAAGEAGGVDSCVINRGLWCGQGRRTRYGTRFWNIY